ncbi:hypothetical protein ES703_125243 [subsurface metagenome]
MKNWRKSLGKGERGFTLIELLVVIAILGVLAAVMVPNVGKFIGSGTVEGANTEAHNVQTAVMAAMADLSICTLDTGASVGPDRISSVTDNGTAVSVEDYFIGSLQATYDLGADGAITGATPDADGKWKDLIYTVEEGGWQQ